MRITFLDGSRPVVEGICSAILDRHTERPADLSSTIVIVPTLQAGRRLREGLARRLADEESGVLIGDVMTPFRFLSSLVRGPNIAGPLDVRLAWCDLLPDVPFEDLRRLIPVEPPVRDGTWRLQTAELFESIRSQLIESGLTVSSVATSEALPDHEVGRWEQLAGLETRLIQRLSEAGLRDPVTALLEAANDPGVDEGIHSILVAATPDPAPILFSVLESLSRTVDIDVLVHAADRDREGFDRCGRPDPVYWCTGTLDIPSASERIHMAANPAAQADYAVSLLTSAGEGLDPLETAIGVPDGDVTPLLIDHLATEGITAYDPAGLPYTGHPLYQLVETAVRFRTTGDYESVRDIVRHADVLGFLGADQAGEALEAMDGLDDLQNRLLPAAVDELFSELERTADDQPESMVRVFRLMKLLREPDQDPFEILLSFLREVYSVRELRPGEPESDLFITIARTLLDCIRLMMDATRRFPGLEPSLALDLVLDVLESDVVYPDPTPDALELEGWLELHWNDAPHVILTGMNEGFVPDGRLADVFLPDTLRQALGLRCDRVRHARDAYLLHAVIAQRRQEGSVHLVAGRAGLDGDVRIPSRLLFQCPDSELTQRARRLLDSGQEAKPVAAPDICFRLRTDMDDEGIQRRIAFHTLGVTRFRDYLACPFRYYLKNILEMGEKDDRKDELDALDFGNLIHDALKAWAEDDKLRDSTSEKAIAACLSAALTRDIRQRFTGTLPLQVEAQVAAAEQRLKAFAAIQAEERRQGWKLEAWERKIEWPCGDGKVVGRVDRIDRHRDGRVRILDYKTSDRADEPSSIHLGMSRDEHRDYMRVQAGGKERSWKDLQLPLYLLAAGHLDIDAAGFSAGYVTLPKAISETTVQMWPELDAAMLASAEACAAGVWQDLRRRRFWPPSERVRYDDFEELMPGPAEEWVDGGALAAQEIPE